MRGYLRPMAPTAAAAIVCGDPARALAIAQHVIDRPRMSNHHRGLWGYHGHTPAGQELTVHATGIGGPSAALTLSELGKLGVQRVVRIGTCRALDKRGTYEHSIGDRVLVRAALAADGTSAALGFACGSELAADPELLARLRAAQPLSEAKVLSTDIGPGGKGDDPAGAQSAAVTDLQSAALLSAGRRCAVAVAVTLIVADAGDDRLQDEPLEAASLALAESASTALAETAPPPEAQPEG